MPIKSYIDKSEDLTVFKAKTVLSFDDAMPVIKAFYNGDPKVIGLLKNIDIIRHTNPKIKKGGYLGCPFKLAPQHGLPSAPLRVNSPWIPG